MYDGSTVSRRGSPRAGAGQSKANGEWRATIRGATRICQRIQMPRSTDTSIPTDTRTQELMRERPLHLGVHGTRLFMLPRLLGVSWSSSAWYSAADHHHHHTTHHHHPTRQLWNLCYNWPTGDLLIDFHGGTFAPNRPTSRHGEEQGAWRALTLADFASKRLLRQETHPPYIFFKVLLWACAHI